MSNDQQKSPQGSKDSTVRPPIASKVVFLKYGSKLATQPPKPTNKPAKVAARDSNKEKELDAEPLYGKLREQLLKEGGLAIGEKLGSGSYSVVLKATAVTSTMGKPKPVAVKIICTSQKNDYIVKFLPRESKIVADLIHPNIVRFYSVKDYGPNLPFTVFITEWCEGGDLLKKIKTLQQTGVKGMPEPDMKTTFRQLAESLLYLDQKNICHRDLKCENIMLDQFENVKLGDFGFARVLMPDERSYTFCGSRTYVAPEIVISKAYHGRPADVWSVGILLYVSTTGFFPFDETNHEKMIANQLAHRVKFPSRWTGSKELKTLILAALEPVPDKRPNYSQMIAHDFLKNTLYVQRK